MPSSGFSCPSAISTAEPVTKPEITGWLSRFATKPMRSNPSSSRITPPMSASSIDSSTYSALPAAASGAMAEAVISEATATGPTDSVMLEPNSA